MAIKTIKKTGEVKMKLRSKIFICLGLVTSISAEVPHSFTPDTIMNSREMNENFTSLDKRIKLLKDKKNSHSNDSTVSCKYNSECSPKSNFKYEYIDSTIGDEITIGTKKYKIIALPFEEFETKEHYYLKYPLELSQTDDIVFYYTNKDISCYPDKIKEFPAKFSIGEYRRDISVDNKISESKISMDDILYDSLEIKVNKTEINISFFSKQNIIEEDTGSNQSDFRDEIDFTDLHNPKELMDNRKFLNYIEVVKLEN